jgi:hypothetical protein
MTSSDRAGEGTKGGQTIKNNVHLNQYGINMKSLAPEPTFHLSAKAGTSKKWPTGMRAPMKRLTERGEAMHVKCWPGQPRRAQ